MTALENKAFAIENPTSNLILAVRMTSVRQPKRNEYSSQLNFEKIASIVILLLFASQASFMMFLNTSTA